MQRSIKLHVVSLEESLTVRENRSDAAPVINQGGAFKPFDRSSCVSLSVGGNIRAPKKIRDLSPQFPASLKGIGAEGTVVLDATIGLDGFLKNIEVRDGADPELAAAAVTAVRQWQYTQTVLNCEPVEVAVKITTRFTHPQ